MAGLPARQAQEPLHSLRHLHAEPFAHGRRSHVAVAQDRPASREPERPWSAPRGARGTAGSAALCRGCWYQVGGASYDVDAAIMHIQRHERGIHALSLVTGAVDVADACSAARHGRERFSAGAPPITASIATSAAEGH